MIKQKNIRLRKYKDSHKVHKNSHIKEKEVRKPKKEEIKPTIHFNLRVVVIKGNGMS